MNRTEAIYKVKSAIDKANLKKGELFEDMISQTTYKISLRILSYLLLALIIIISNFSFVYYKDFLNGFVLGFLFFSINIFGTSLLFGDIFGYIREEKTIFFKNREIKVGYNHKNASKNKLSLSLYNKILPFLDKEDYKEILSCNLTYKDLDL